MSPFLGNSVVVISLLILVSLLSLKRFKASELWQATVTPLASIIGSGFLVSAPLVILTSGKWAAVVMFIVVVVAYFLGHVMRFNIYYLEPLIMHRKKTDFVMRLESFSKIMLGIAYVISVAFYIKLLAIFLFQGFTIKNSIYDNMITTVILAFIGIIGWTRGLHVLEILEKYAVNTKLIIIVTLIIGSLMYNIDALIQHTWFLVERNPEDLFQSFRKILGILIIIQGFETSRYLGQTYSAAVRIKSMKYAQFISGAIYVFFVSFSMAMFNDISAVTETVVIDLCRLIAPILPTLLIVAAIMSQFSAAVADSMGSSGLTSEATQKLISIKQGLLITVCIAILLIWLTNIYEIIVIASKAFAAYYFIQCIIASKIAYSKKFYFFSIMFTLLAMLMVLVLIISEPVS